MFSCRFPIYGSRLAGQEMEALRIGVAASRHSSLWKNRGRVSESESVFAALRFQYGT